VAFPTIVNSAPTTAAAGTTAVPMSMPASIVAGRLLLSFIGGGAFVTMSATGWTPTARWASAGLSVTILSKIAAGSDTMSVARSISSALTGRTYQIDTWPGSLANIWSNGPSGATLTNPPALTPPGGAADYLWFAALFTTTTTVATAAPANYSNLLTVSNSASFALNTASRALNAATEDPGAFTDAAATTNNAAVTLAIGAPTAGPTGAFFPFFGMGHHDEQHDELAARRRQGFRRPSGLHLPRPLALARAA